MYTITGPFQQTSRFPESVVCIHLWMPAWLCRAWSELLGRIFWTIYSESLAPPAVLRQVWIGFLTFISLPLLLWGLKNREQPLVNWFPSVQGLMGKVLSKLCNQVEIPKGHLNSNFCHADKEPAIPRISYLQPTCHFSAVNSVFYNLMTRLICVAFWIFLKMSL